MKFKSREQKKHFLWVWEFSKKAVLICFISWVIVQLYSMTVMFISSDFTNLGELIDTSSRILETCVFGYLIKAGAENVVKILFEDGNQDDEIVE